MKPRQIVAWSLLAAIVAGGIATGCSPEKVYVDAKTGKEAQPSIPKLRAFDVVLDADTGCKLNGWHVHGGVVYVQKYRDDGAADCPNSGRR